MSFLLSLSEPMFSCGSRSTSLQMRSAAQRGEVPDSVSQHSRTARRLPCSPYAVQCSAAHCAAQCSPAAVLCSALCCAAQRGVSHTHRSPFELPTCCRSALNARLYRTHSSSSLDIVLGGSGAEALPSFCALAFHATWLASLSSS